MKLEEIYHRCGLKTPEDYKKDLFNEVLFSENQDYQRHILVGGRLSGKTTNFLMQALHNMYHGRSTLILVRTLSMTSHYNGKFKRYADLFPELAIEEGRDYFEATFVPKHPLVKFISVHNGIWQSGRVHLLDWDDIFDDTN